MKIKIRQISQVSAGPYGDEEDGKFPSELTLLASYEKIEKFLKENAETIAPQKINPLPYIEDGIITSPSGNSIYFLENCLVENIWDPMPFGPFRPRKGHAVRVAGSLSEVDKSIPLIKINLDFMCRYSEKEEKIYQTKQNINLRTFSSISDLEKELSTPEEIKRPDNLFEQTKNLERIGARLSGEPEILHDIEDYFRNVEFYPVVRDQIKRILQYVPAIFSEDWKSPESFDKLSEKEKQAYTDIAKNGIKCVPGPIIQKVIELGVEYKNKYEIKQNV